MFLYAPVAIFKRYPSCIYISCHNYGMRASYRCNPLGFISPGDCALLTAFMLIRNSTLGKTCIWAYPPCCVPPTFFPAGLPCDASGTVTAPSAAAASAKHNDPSFYSMWSTLDGEVSLMQQQLGTANDTNLPGDIWSWYMQRAGRSKGSTSHKMYSLMPKSPLH